MTIVSALFTLSIFCILILAGTIYAMSNEIGRLHNRITALEIKNRRTTVVAGLGDALRIKDL